MYLRRKMYSELGGYLGYRKTPLRELIECRLSIIAEINVQDEQAKEQEEKRKEAEREAERARGRR